MLWGCSLSPPLQKILFVILDSAPPFPFSYGGAGRGRGEGVLQGASGWARHCAGTFRHSIGCRSSAPKGQFVCVYTFFSQISLIPWISYIWLDLLATLPFWYTKLIKQQISMQKEKNQSFIECECVRILDTWWGQVFPESCGLLWWIRGAGWWMRSV